MGIVWQASVTWLKCIKDYFWNEKEGSITFEEEDIIRDIFSVLNYLQKKICWFWVSNEDDFSYSSLVHL